MITLLQAAILGTRDAPLILGIAPLLETDHWDWKIDEWRQAGTWDTTGQVVVSLLCLILLHSPPPDPVLRRQDQASALTLPSWTRQEAIRHHPKAEKPACFSSLPAWLSFQGESNELGSVRTDFSLVSQQCGDWCGDGNTSNKTGKAFKDFWGCQSLHLELQLFLTVKLIRKSSNFYVDFDTITNYKFVLSVVHT